MCLAVLHPLSLSMHFPNRSGWLRRSAATALFLGALPLSLHAQIRRPDPAPTNQRSSSKAPKHRTEILKGGGILNLNEANATKASMFVGSAGFRRQMSPEWLYLGGLIDIGRTTIDGSFFPFEKRPVGDSVQFVQVDGHATLIAPRFTADVLLPIDEAERFRAGAGINAGVYAMLPSPKGGTGAGTLIAPTFGAAFIGEADLSAKFGVTASLGFTQFLNFDREKLRPSDPAKADPVFQTPLITPPPGVKSFGGARLIIGLSYRLGVKTIPKRAK